MAPVVNRERAGALSPPAAAEAASAFDISPQREELYGNRS
jgi:hypothetical protein